MSANGLAASELPKLDELAAVNSRCRRASRPASVVSASAIDAALGNIFEQLRQRGGGLAVERAGLGLVLLAHAHCIDDDEAIFAAGAWSDDSSLSGEMTRTPRPFICSKNPADLTLRMKKTHSIGFTSVPVEIMSTVTAMRGIEAVAKVGENFIGRES